MISRAYIESTLNELDNLYRSASSRKKEIIYSKLAIIELCGWIEVSFDDIIQITANRTLKDQPNRDYVKNVIIKKNYGFDYDHNIRSMIMRLLGLSKLERIEKKMERHGKITVLKALLSNLKTSRNKAAHTFLKGTTLTFDAPSTTKSNFSNLYNLIIEYRDEVERIS